MRPSGLVSGLSAAVSGEWSAVGVSGVVAGRRMSRLCLPCAVLTAALVFAPSCKKSDDASSSPVSPGSLRATAEWQSDGSKTHLGEVENNNAPLLWDAGDKVEVTCDNGATFYRFFVSDIADDGVTADLNTEEGVPDDFYTNKTYQAVYPVRSGSGWDDLRGMASHSTSKITVYLPHVQRYADKSFGLGDNPMYGTGSSDDYKINFQNLCGVLRLSLKGDDKVKRIVVTSKGGELLWGEGELAEDGGKKMLKADGLTKGTSSVLLDCGEGVQLSSTPTMFDIVLPVGALDKGFHVRAFGNKDGVEECEWGLTATPHGSAGCTIERSTMARMDDAIVRLEQKWVDMGTGVKWAKCNLGASEEYEYGDYYGWGATSVLYSSKPSQTGTGTTLDLSGATYGWNGWCPFFVGSSSSDIKFSKYVTTSTPSYGAVDNKDVLEAVDDVARMSLGGEWRMPDRSDFEALYGGGYTWDWKTDYNGSGVSGYLVTNETSGENLFLPAAGNCNVTSRYVAGSHGYYWSRSLYSSTPCNAYFLYFLSGSVLPANNGTRCYGLSVRPVL